MTQETIQIQTQRGPVSGVWSWRPGERGVVVVAHGAGNDMNAPLLVGFTDCLAEAQYGSLRFNFPYREAGKKAPDGAPVLVQAWQAAFEEAKERIGAKPVFAAGKSLGGRIASMAVAEGMPAAGLIFLGYPLHAPGRPERTRDQHLDGIRVPMLFLQGTADPFARFDLIQALAKRLGRWAVLHPVEGGNHSFRVRGEGLSDSAVGRLLGSVAVRFLQSAQV